ncbi:MAG: glycosyltransferase family 2 protein [Chthoniobacteraceae bacterium]|nr:glycosyltransferase family 2 protein [Chthoniobacteraceae bacterium]
MSNPSLPDLILVMPIYNEEANITQVISEWLPVLSNLGIRYELFAINDGSKDRTLPILQSLACEHPGNIVVIDKPNSGHGRSCRAGYERALERSARWILQIDSDGQCDPSYFPSFWSQREEADCVFGFRSTRGDGLVRKLISRSCGVLSSLVSGVNVRDANVPYRLMRNEALAQALPRVPADFDVQNIALTVALKRCQGIRWRYVPIHFRDRQGGVNSINIRKIAKMGWKMLNELRRVQ